MFQQEEKQPFGRLDGIKFSWKILIRCMQLMPIIGGVVGMMVWMVWLFNHPVKPNYLLIQQNMWWMKHGETVYCFVYLFSFVFWGLVLRAFVEIVKCHPRTFKKSDESDIQVAVDEMIRYARACIWVCLFWIAVFSVACYFGMP